MKVLEVEGQTGLDLGLHPSGDDDVAILDLMLPQVGDLVVDPASHSATVGGVDVRLRLRRA